MPSGVENQISNIFNAIGSAIIEGLLLYFVTPFIIAILIFRFVFKIRGKFLSFIMFITALVCLYFYALNGLPEIQNIFFSKVK